MNIYMFLIKHFAGDSVYVIRIRS